MEYWIGLSTDRLQAACAAACDIAAKRTRCHDPRCIACLPACLPAWPNPPQDANSRWLLLVLWMTRMGSGLLPAKDVVSTARRLRVS